MGKINIIFFYLAICLQPLFGSAWDVEYWQYLNIGQWECGHQKTYADGGIRLNKNASRFYYYRLTENYVYQANTHIDFEAHYSFIYNKPRGAENFYQLQRLEFEINPKFSFENGISLRWRNRYELIKKEHINKLQSVLRHRILAIFPLDGCGYLSSINCSNEFYYDLNTCKFTQNRLVPVELHMILNSKFSMNLFFMVRNFFSSDTSKWYRSFVLGSEILF